MSHPNCRCVVPDLREPEKPTFAVGDRFKANKRHPDFLIEVPEGFRQDCKGEVIGVYERWRGGGGTVYTLRTWNGWFQCLGMDWAQKAIKPDGG